MHVIVLSLVAKLSVVASPALVGRRSEFYDHRVSTDTAAISCMQFSLRRWRISELNANTKISHVAPIFVISENK